LFSAITILRCRCGEVHPSALTLIRGRFVCGNCRERERGIKETLCEKCGNIAPSHKHHKFGRMISNQTVRWCVNCHQKYHKGKSVQAIENRKQEMDITE
jgi:hypothetical protein